MPIWGPAQATLVPQPCQGLSRVLALRPKPPATTLRSSQDTPQLPAHPTSAPLPLALLPKIQLGTEAPRMRIQPLGPDSSVPSNAAPAQMASRASPSSPNEPGFAQDPPPLCSPLLSMAQSLLQSHLPSREPPAGPCSPWLTLVMSVDSTPSISHTQSLSCGLELLMAPRFLINYATPLPRDTELLMVEDDILTRGHVH